MSGDNPVSKALPRRADALVRVAVLDAHLEDDGAGRAGVCRLVVESARPLPASPYAGTVRVGGACETATGVYPVRILKHFVVEPLDAADGSAVYRLAVDLSDEWPGPPPGLYVPPGYRPRVVTEILETICKRVAGLFGRHCEQYRPPSVTVRLEP